MAEGITNTQKEYVMWLDADGSMDIESINKLISEYLNNNNSLYRITVHFWRRI